MSHPIHCAALLRCATCGRTVPVVRAELPGLKHTGPPRCCDAEMDLFIPAERVKPDDTQIIALPVSLLDPNRDTDIMPAPAPRKLPD